MGLKNITDKPFLSWIKLAFASGRSADKRPARVHPLQLEGSKACFAVSVGERWLCGSDGSLTVFDSPAAASRLLGTMNIEDFSHGKPVTRDRGKELPRQCFQLRNGELAHCLECAIRAAAASPEPEKYSSWTEEDWSRWEEED